MWVVDSADRMRMEACREELNILLLEERLAGATLLVLANKQDLPGALSAQEIKDVSSTFANNLQTFIDFPPTDSRVGQHYNSSLVSCRSQCCHG